MKGRPEAGPLADFLQARSLVGAAARRRARSPRRRRRRSRARCASARRRRASSAVEHIVPVVALVVIAAGRHRRGRRRRRDRRRRVVAGVVVTATAGAESSSPSPPRELSPPWPSPSSSPVSPWSHLISVSSVTRPLTVWPWNRLIVSVAVPSNEAIVPASSWPSCSVVVGVGVARIVARLPLLAVHELVAVLVAMSLVDRSERPCFFSQRSGMLVVVTVLRGGDARKHQRHDPEGRQKQRPEPSPLRVFPCFPPRLRSGLGLQW